MGYEWLVQDCDDGAAPLGPTWPIDLTDGVSSRPFTCHFNRGESSAPARSIDGPGRWKQSMRGRRDQSRGSMAKGETATVDALKVETVDG